MRDYTHFYIGGHWLEPARLRLMNIVNPSTEAVTGQLALGSMADVNLAVEAARAGSASFGAASRAERIELLEAICAQYVLREDDLVAAVSDDMGAPSWLSRRAHVPSGIEHFQTAIEILKSYRFEVLRGSTMLRYEPIGVCAMITPWNWPLNQIGSMVAPALAVGCTVVLKPSEMSPGSAQVLTEVLHAAGVPAGVFNLIYGDGPVTGAALSAHPGVDMVSFTGSTRAGVEVARRAAPTVKRVRQELGGKSPNILLDDADFTQSVKHGVTAVMRNSGQTCTAPTRMLVPRKRMEEVKAIAYETAAAMRVGPPSTDVQLGPVVSKTQWDKVQSMIEAGMSEGASLVAGGLGKPEGLDKGYYVKPTVFADVNNDMHIAREEIFGPVLCIIGYDDEDEAVALANDTPYGLAAYVQSGNVERARAVAARLQAGQVRINGANEDPMAPFGGYKQSGNGREGGEFGFAEYLEVKAVMGYEPKTGA